MANQLYTFGKKEHLKSRKHIQQVFTGGKSVFANPIKMLWQKIALEQLSPNITQPAIMVGVTASSRNFKKATDRNRIKRLLREAYRLNKLEIEAAVTAKNLSIQIFFVFVDKALPTFEIVQEKMAVCLKKLQKTIEDIPNEKLL